ncbi:hypothetical protein, partial [Weissella paramesenteroides]
VPTITKWAGDGTNDQLYKTFEGVVDVIALRLATDDKIGYDAWVRDDALATGIASAIWTRIFWDGFATTDGYRDRCLRCG